MKAAPFAYVRPAALQDAVAELAATDGGGKVIAGGQSLVPVMAMRLARPETLVDITAVDGLDELHTKGNTLEVGAMVRQRRVEREPVAQAVPLLGMALPWVGHRELRSRGTVCGSLAHADPAAEIPAVACCLDAQIVLNGPKGKREVSARDFFTGAMTTALGPDEILSSVRFPVTKRGEGFGFTEFARRHGDFALAGVVTRVTVRAERIEQAILTAFGVSDHAVTRDVSSVLTVADGGSDRTRLATRLIEPLREVADEVVDTAGDAHGSRDYRKRLFVTLAARELDKAHERAVRDSREST